MGAAGGGANLLILCRFRGSRGVP